MKACSIGYGSIAVLALSIGCTEAVTSTENADLGIASFQAVERADKTTVVGLDASGQEVGRLELIHGRFALTEGFQADYPGQPEVEGRKLDVILRGERQYVWETAGFEPILHMPGHPSSRRELAAFFADPHVQVVLDRWQIGFEPAAEQAEEAEYYWDMANGTSYTVCGKSNCGSVDGYTINKCNGSGAGAGGKVWHASPYDEWTMGQNCPAGTGGQSVKWIAFKTCATTHGAASSCGTSTGACKGCGLYALDEPAGETEFTYAYDSSESQLWILSWDPNQAYYCSGNGLACEAQTVPGVCDGGGACPLSS